MTTPLMVALCGIFLELIVLVIAGVLGVNAIKTTTAVLNETIRTLKRTIDELRDTIKEIQTELWEHKSKIAVLEARQ